MSIYFTIRRSIDVIWKYCFENCGEFVCVFFYFLKKIIVFYKIQNTQRKKFKNILLKIGQSAKWVFIILNFDVSGMNFYCVTIYSMKSSDWISVVLADGQSI